MNKGSHFNGQFPLPEWQTSWDNNKDDIWTLLFRSRCMISWLVGLTNSSVVIRFKLSLMNRKNAKMLEEAREGPFEPTLFWLRGGLLFPKIIRNACLWALRIGLLCYLSFSGYVYWQYSITKCKHVLNWNTILDFFKRTL